MTADIKQLLSAVEAECNRVTQKRKGLSGRAAPRPSEWAVSVMQKLNLAMTGLTLNYRQRMIEVAATVLLAICAWDQQNAREEEGQKGR